MFAESNTYDNQTIYDNNCTLIHYVSVFVIFHRVDIFAMDIMFQMWTSIEKNVELENLIPAKFRFGREIFAILRGNLSFRWLFLLFSYKNFRKCVNKNTFLTKIPGKCCIFSSLGCESYNEMLKIWFSS